MKIIILTLLLASTFLGANGQGYKWSILSKAPYNGGKQDGIYFINKDTGWVVNGSGKISRTLDGGTSWTQQKNSAGTYFRSVAFIDDKTGFAGNVGAGYFPGVTDSTPLYKSIDGGNSWASVTSSISGKIPGGICAIQVVNSKVIYAAGRVGGPAVIIKSTDGGNSWVGTDLSSKCNMILDIHFHSADTGYIFAGTDADITNANAIILRTNDGGKTWTKVYTSSRTYEIMWKAWFPSHDIGYATIQSYNTNTTQRYIAKTTDGGLTWKELPLDNSGVREFGVGFINDSVGWVGTEGLGLQTVDGGATWTSKNVGDYANKFSIIKNSTGGATCYTVGLNVLKMKSGTAGIMGEEEERRSNLMVYPNPCASGGYISISLDKSKTKIIRSELVNIEGKSTYTLFNSYFVSTHESPFMFKLPEVPAGQYILRFTDEKNEVTSQKILIRK